MVDINLIGDDQAQFDEDSEKDFQDTYGSDASDLTQNTYMRGDGIDSSDYAKVMKRGGSKVGVIVLFIVVIALLATTAYILFKPGKTNQQAQSNLSVFQDNAFTEGVADSQRTDAQLTDTESQVDTDPMQRYDVSPALREEIVKSHHGVNSVSQIMNSIPASVNFTMITYNDGNVLFELLTENANDISGIDDVLKQRLNSSDIRLISQDTKYIKSRQYHQALISGNVDISNTPQNLTSIQPPQFLNSTDLEQRISAICEEKGLRIKQFDTGREKNLGELMVLPITFRVYGLKAGITDLMRQILTQNINVSFVKISLIANEPNLTSPYLTLVLNLTLYRTA